MSDLLKMSLALEDHQLRRRVTAALVLYANTVKHREDDYGVFGRLVLNNPNSPQWDPFMYPVTTNDDVLAAIALAPDNSQVFVTNVTDEKIIELVNNEAQRNHKRYIPGGE